MTVLGWTLEDAVAMLHPAMTGPEVRALVMLFGLSPIGHRTIGRGRPPAVYDIGQLLQAHAAVISTRSRQPAS
ncbi:hypothetical protein [Herbidospora mongoliensis]|uniref:hypothetical protein n=1 Tax=Herbidospora mongoliensis TaxID=688067 RepID=UPI000833E66F|nr:hypothetical protein [Herbidospora mongoliensis]